MAKQPEMDIPMFNANSNNAWNPGILATGMAVCFPENPPENCTCYICKSLKRFFMSRKAFASENQEGSLQCQDTNRDLIGVT